VVAPLLESMARAAEPDADARPEESTALRARLKELERQNILRSLSRARVA